MGSALGVRRGKMPEYIVEASDEEIFSTSSDSYNTEYMTPIVRCKDCKFRKRESVNPFWCSAIHHSVSKYSFCSWGERRAGA